MSERPVEKPIENREVKAWKELAKQQPSPKASKKIITWEAKIKKVVQPITVTRPAVRLVEKVRVIKKEKKEKEKEHKPTPALFQPTKPPEEERAAEVHPPEEEEIYPPEEEEEEEVELPPPLPQKEVKPLKEVQPIHTGKVQPPVIVKVPERAPIPVSTAVTEELVEVVPPQPRAPSPPEVELQPAPIVPEASVEATGEGKKKKMNVNVAYSVA